MICHICKSCLKVDLIPFGNEYREQALSSHQHSNFQEAEKPKCLPHPLHGCSVDTRVGTSCLTSSISSNSADTGHVFATITTFPSGFYNVVTGSPHLVLGKGLEIYICRCLFWCSWTFMDAGGILLVSLRPGSCHPQGSLIPDPTCGEGCESSRPESPNRDLDEFSFLTCHFTLSSAFKQFENMFINYLFLWNLLNEKPPFVI